MKTIEEIALETASKIQPHNIEKYAWEDFASLKIEDAIREAMNQCRPYMGHHLCLIGKFDRIENHISGCTCGYEELIKQIRGEK